MNLRRLVSCWARSSVRSDTGVEIRVAISYVTYAEGDYVLKGGRELACRAADQGRKKTAVWLIALKPAMLWESPNRNEEIKPEKREQIGKTIKAALEFLKIEYET